MNYVLLLITIFLLIANKSNSMEDVSRNSKYKGLSELIPVKGKYTSTKGWILLDSEFVPKFMNLVNIFNRWGFEVVVTSSFRNYIPSKGAIVKPATRSPHMAGHAVDINLKRISDGKVFSFSNGGLNKITDENILNAIKDAKKSGLRWGGDFKSYDPVHFDDAINIKEPERYSAKVEKYKNVVLPK